MNALRTLKYESKLYLLRNVYLQKINRKMFSLTRLANAGAANDGDAHSRGAGTLVSHDYVNIALLKTNKNLLSSL